MLEGAYWRKKLRPLLVNHVALKHEALVVKHASPYASGLPDFSVSIGKHTEFFELKMHPNVPSKLQLWTLSRLGDAGHLITVFKNGVIHLDGLVFMTPNPLLSLVEEIVAMCTHKVPPIEIARARLDEATNWHHQFNDKHDDDSWCCKRENELRDEVHAIEVAL
jgi:hypothetical protein